MMRQHSSRHAAAERQHSLRRPSLRHAAAESLGGVALAPLARHIACWLERVRRGACRCGARVQVRHCHRGTLGAHCAARSAWRGACRRRRPAARGCRRCTLSVARSACTARWVPARRVPAGAGPAGAGPAGAGGAGRGRLKAPLPLPCPCTSLPRGTVHRGTISTARRARCVPAAAKGVTGT